MMVEAGGLVEQRKDTMTMRHVNSKVRYVNKPIKKLRCKKRSKPVVSRVPRLLPELFVACREVFKGPGNVPPPSDVDKLCSILDRMKPEDVGLSKNLQFFKARGAVTGTPRVTYTTIYQCDEFSHLLLRDGGWQVLGCNRQVGEDKRMQECGVNSYLVDFSAADILCIFFLPEKAVIPLHNHPGMTVFSKLLLGKMHIKSYDWVDPVHSEDPVPPSQPRLARLKADSVFTAPCDTSVLYPTAGGNIHQFTAITPCAVLDVLGPPYSKEDDRDCSYYRDVPCSAFPNGETTVSEEEEGDLFGWLEEIQVPENSKMDRIEYLGPQIAETSF
ncbi:Cysteine oxygenase/2-aminoethanethiol dioxygenase - like 5 [Theobroma cacao]|nr:Cysteine oxygenase/2-aminoethanethiol dioxygenase - like 5 [Theobroma cacao]